MAFQLIQTHIKVEGTDDEIIFSNLIINQYLADVNSFTFTWRQPEGESTLSAHVSFYKKNLSKAVTINVNNDLTFKGIISAINCNNQDSLGVSYEIKGKGLFAKLDEVEECNSFYKKKLDDIFKAVNTGQGTTLKSSPNNKTELFYTVQYNQTNFEFMRMLAARYGEWLYYNGTDLVMGNPDSEAISLTHNQDVHDVDITAQLAKAPNKNAGFDVYKGEVIHGDQKPTGKGGGFMEAAVNAGENAFGSSQKTAHVSSAATADLLKNIATLDQKSAAASSVIVSARSDNSKLKLAGKIKMLDEKGGSAGEYIITEIHHNCITNNNYQNQFVAVPAETEVPPYTNPELFALCKPQPALVTDNVDKDGMDRIKVRFPWQQQSESTPWLSVLTPHAGKGKGFRFLPEVGEEVFVGFLDNNSERPFVMGAVHTEKNKSGQDPEKNNLKVIGTRSGRRFVIDDDKGQIYIQDDEKAGNYIGFSKSSDQTNMKITSATDDNNFSVISLDKESKLAIGIKKGGTVVVDLEFDSENKKITIHSKGSIELNADDSISLNAANINIIASQELKMEGKSKGASLKGLKIDVAADTDVAVKGQKGVSVESMKTDIKGTAMVAVNGGMVTIN